MIRIGSDTDIGINRNSSDWFEINFNLILSPGIVKEPNVDQCFYILIIWESIFMWIVTFQIKIKLSKELSD